VFMKEFHNSHDIGTGSGPAGPALAGPLLGELNEPYYVAPKERPSVVDSRQVLWMVDGDLGRRLPD